MTEDQDNAGEVVAAAVRVALTAAGQLAEQAARRREADLRQAERDSAARVATLQSQLAAERELASREVHDVIQRGDAATVKEVVHAWEQARSWQDPTMAAERAQLEDRLRERFGFDASSVPVHRSSGELASAARLMAHDVDVQADDAHHRGQGRGHGVQMATTVPTGVDREAVAARDLAALSHPTDPNQAARAPHVPSGQRARGTRRHRVAEVQSPGR